MHGNNFDEAKAEALRLKQEQNLVFIHPFDGNHLIYILDPYVIAGQGTIGMEILKQIPYGKLDAIFVCVGGGGLIAGIGR